MSPRKLTVVAATAATVLSATVATATGATATPSTETVPHSKPTWTTNAKHLGHASAASKVQARVYFAPRGGLAGLQQTVDAISTPGSASYQHYLSQPAFQQRFGITDATVHAAAKYLRGQGLKVGGASANNHYVTVTGTVGSAEKAFGAKIDRYVHNGKNVQAPTASLTVPGSLGVLAVTGLDTTAHLMAPASKQDTPVVPAGFRNARPCSRYYGQVEAEYQNDFTTPLPKYRGKTLPYVLCGYTGPQLRGAYEGGTTLTGKGVTVGIVDAYNSPTIEYDSTHYASENGDAGYAAGQYVSTTPSTFTHQGACSYTGWYGEQTLDVEAVHAMAGDAQIHYYGAKSCDDKDFTDAIQRVVDQDKVQIVSNSYGEPEEALTTDLIAANEAVYLQGAAEGISFLFSSGDHGDEVANTGLKQPDADASDPYVTAVGGTATGIGPNNELEFQTGWGTGLAALKRNGKAWGPTNFNAGAGGGVSRLFNQPSYQHGVYKSAYRTVPDVAMDADNATGMVIGETQQFPDGTYYDQFRLGGTSLASPLFAGMTALAVQQAGHAGGFLNPTIYAARSTSFTDVLAAKDAGVPDPGVVRVNFANSVDSSEGYAYSVRTFDQDSSLQTTPGYDLVTGVGVPNPAWFTTLG